MLPSELTALRLTDSDWEHRTLRRLRYSNPGASRRWLSALPARPHLLGLRLHSLCCVNSYGRNCVETSIMSTEGLRMKDGGLWSAQGFYQGK